MTTIFPDEKFTVDLTKKDFLTNFVLMVRRQLETLLLLRTGGFHAGIVWIFCAGQNRRKAQRGTLDHLLACQKEVKGLTDLLDVHLFRGCNQCEMLCQTLKS